MNKRCLIFFTKPACGRCAPRAPSADPACRFRPMFLKFAVVLGVVLAGAPVSGQIFPFEGGVYGFGETSFTATIDRTIAIEDVDLHLALETAAFGVVEDLEVTLTSPQGTTVQFIASGVLGDLNGFLVGRRLQDTGFSGEAPVSVEHSANESGLSWAPAASKNDRSSTISGVPLQPGRIICPQTLHEPSSSLISHSGP